MSEVRRQAVNSSALTGVFFATATDIKNIPNKPTPIISLRRATKTFGFDDFATDALAGINLEIQRGEFVAIMGPSGCGKTTLLNILGLLDKPTIGRYYFNGRDVMKFSNNRKAKIRNREIGFVFQNFNLVPTMTVIDNVVLPLTYSKGWNYHHLEKASELLKTVGLSNREYYMPNQLSGGQMQRVAIARALVNHPSIILADEPTGNLDSKNSQIVMDELTKLHREGNTILMVTHNPDLLKYASRVIYMKDGQIDSDEELTDTKAFKVTKRTINSHKSKTKTKGTGKGRRIIKRRNSK
ncbi:MAG: ABC transporter ATP-binding protein [Candidatus Saccharibacteria bacterium]|nr:ABC transporter ATP-binding protein [Candidatus Saccharibacteria bacterium]